MSPTRRSDTALRSLSASELALSPPEPPTGDTTAQAFFSRLMLAEDDGILATVRAALADGFAGVIFSGPPGTSKSEYASRIAQTLAGSDSRVRYIQFHPSFQYEDFVEGFTPRPGGGFELVPKHFLRVCKEAGQNTSDTYVLVIDEISRCDAARVFGEALTYIESSKRDIPFSLASGSVASVPKNLVLLATMNPWDRGVDEVDIALERRFAHIAMPPRVEILREMLTFSELSTEEREAVVRFFEAIQRLPNRFVRIGHAYFARIQDRAAVLRLWELQLRHHFERACRSNTAEYEHIEGLWKSVVVRVLAPDQPVANAGVEPTA